MFIIDGMNSQRIYKPTAIALGTFDGVHIGHRAVIKKAAASGITPAVFTFSCPPANAFSPLSAPVITPQSIKKSIIKGLGIEYYIEPNFDEIRELSPDQFILMLIERFGAKKLICGFNFHFGKSASGDAQTLKSLCAQHGIDSEIVDPVTVHGEPVCSSAIRKMIENGDIEKANSFLSTPFCFDFKVTHGAHLGTDFMNTPTINQSWQKGFVLPKFGVYASKTVIGGLKYKSITNIGVSPTVENNTLRAETHIFDFDSQIYGENPTVELYSFVRPERAFKSADELKARIIADSKAVYETEY